MLDEEVNAHDTEAKAYILSGSNLVNLQQKFLDKEAAFRQVADEVADKIQAEINQEQSRFDMEEYGYADWQKLYPLRGRFPPGEFQD